MRRIFAIILIALLLGVGVVAVIKTDPGYVLMSYGNYTLESSLWVGLLLLVGFTILVYGLLRTVYQILGGRRSLISWMGARRMRQSSVLTNRGLASFIEGNWTGARRLLLRGARHHDEPLLHYLLAAKASAQLDDTEAVSVHLGKAADMGQVAAAAAELVRAEIHLAAQQYDQAQACLQRLGGSAAASPRATELRYRALLGQRDWPGLLALLPAVKKHSLLSGPELERLQRDVELGVLTLQAGENREALMAAWQKLGADRRKDTDLLCHYVGLLLQAECHEDARNVLVKALKRHWDPVLVRLFGRVRGEDASAQLAQAERWLSGHEEDEQLLLCLGRLAARDQLWGKAREYFESCYRLKRSPEICAELGRLLTGMGDTAVAAAYFREGLLLAEDELPALPEPDRALSRGRHVAGS